MVLFGLKTYFKIFFLGYFYPPTLSMQKNQVKMVHKQVFTGTGFKSPPFSMSIPEAPSCRVKNPKNLRIHLWSTFWIRRIFVFVFGPFSIFIATLILTLTGDDSDDLWNGALRYSLLLWKFAFMCYTHKINSNRALRSYRSYELFCVSCTSSLIITRECKCKCNWDSSLLKIYKVAKFTSRTVQLQLFFFAGSTNWNVL